MGAAEEGANGQADEAEESAQDECSMVLIRGAEKQMAGLVKAIKPRSEIHAVPKRLSDEYLKDVADAREIAEATEARKPAKS